MPIELQTLVDYFDDAEEASRDARHKSELCRDYYDNVQLTAEEISTLKKRGQPPVVINRIAPKVDFLSGIERRTRTDPKAFPRTPQHDEGADAATDSIRFVLDNNVFDPMASDVMEELIIEGTGGASVEAEVRGEKIEIVIKKFRWDRFFIDPYSMLRDGSDARYTGVISWKDLDDAKQRWPKAAEQLDKNMSEANETFDDKPLHWYDKKRQRVMCVDMYFRYQGTWHHAIFGKQVWLQAPKQSVYVNEDNVPQNPHIFASAKVKRDGQRYGPCEGWLDLQSIINKTRSKAMHLLNTRQTFSKEGRIADIDTFKREANKADGHLQFPNDGTFGSDFGIIPNEQLVAPQFSMYQDAVAQLESISANQALQGRSGDYTSGRGDEIRQQAGMVELSPLFDIHSQWKVRIYRAVWDRIRQFWQEERWVRVTDSEENLKFVGLNQPITLAEQRIMDQYGLSHKEVREQFGKEIDQIHQQEPALAQQIDTSNDVVEIDVDIIIEEVPDVVNLQSEQFELLVQMYQANPNGIRWEDVVAMSTLRNKDRILGKELTPEEQEQVAQQQQQEMEMLDLQKRTAEAGIAAQIARAQKDQAEANAQIIENEVVGSGLGDLLDLQEQAIDIEKKKADALQSHQKAIQTAVETDLLTKEPPPEKVSVI
jgi:hypothetical protein